MKNLNRNIERSLVGAIIHDLGGKFATITAIKKDGSLTVINGQLADSPPSHGGRNHLISIKKGGKDNGYRTFNINKVQKIAFNKQVLTVI